LNGWHEGKLISGSSWRGGQAEARPPLAAEPALGRIGGSLGECRSAPCVFSMGGTIRPGQPRRFRRRIFLWAAGQQSCRRGAAAWHRDLFRSAPLRSAARSV